MTTLTSPQPLEMTTAATALELRRRNRKLGLNDMGNLGPWHSCTRTAILAWRLASGQSGLLKISAAVTAQTCQTCRRIIDYWPFAALSTRFTARTVMANTTQITDRNLRKSLKRSQRKALKAVDVALTAPRRQARRARKEKKVSTRVPPPPTKTSRQQRLVLSRQSWPYPVGSRSRRLAGQRCELKSEFAVAPRRRCAYGHSCRSHR